MMDLHVNEWRRWYGWPTARWEDDGGYCPPPLSPSLGFLLDSWAPADKKNSSDARFDSVSEFLEWVHRGPPVHRANQYEYQDFLTGDLQSHYNSKNVQYLGFGCNTGEDVERMVRKGWPEGLERALILVSENDTPPVDQKRRLTRTDLGDNVDIAAVYSGHHMTAWTRAKRRHMISPQRVEFVVDLSTPWFEQAESMFWKGAAAVAASDMLESSGYITRIVVARGGPVYARDKVEHRAIHQPDCYRSTRIIAKDYGQALDPSTTGAVLIPGFARALMGAWDRLTAPVPTKWGSFVVGPPALDEGEYVVRSSVHNEDSARRWIAEVVGEINSKHID